MLQIVGNDVDSFENQSESKYDTNYDADGYFSDDDDVSTTSESYATCNTSEESEQEGFYDISMAERLDNYYSGAIAFENDKIELVAFKKISD